jgi:hypothetical protein
MEPEFSGTERRLLVHEGASPATASFIFLCVFSLKHVSRTEVVFVDNVFGVVLDSLFYHGPTI